MKNLRRVIPGVLCLTVAWCLVAATPRAQDPTQAAASNFKVLLENDRVRVLDFHGKAGEKIAMHSHPAYISYRFPGAEKRRSLLRTVRRRKERRTPARLCGTRRKRIAASRA